MGVPEQGHPPRGKSRGLGRGYRRTGRAAAGASLRFAALCPLNDLALSRRDSLLNRFGHRVLGKAVPL